MELDPNDRLYLHRMGLAFRITAIFASNAEANGYMARNEQASVIAVHGGFVLLADKDDQGIPLGTPRAAG